TGLVGDIADENLNIMLKHVGELNNKFTRERIDTLENQVNQFIAQDYSDSVGIRTAFDSLKALYNACRIDSKRFDEAAIMIGKAIKDSLIRENEADRILFALEKSIMKYIPRELTIPFNVNFTGKLNDIASDGKYLWVATDSGLFRYRDGWQRFGTDYGFPTNSIKSLTLYKKMAFLGTDTGLVLYDAGAVTYFGSEHGLPQLPVSGVAVYNEKRAWAIIGDDIYQYDGLLWRNYIETPVASLPAAEKIYDIMKIFDTPAERERFLKKFKDYNPETPGILERTAEGQSDSIMVMDSMVMVTDSTAEEKPMDSSMQATVARIKEAAKADSKSGPKAKIPIAAGLKFKVLSTAVDQSGSLWIGTEFGILKFTGKSWKRYGYRKYPIDKDITVFELALSKVKGDSTRAQRLADNISRVNELESDTLKAGMTIDIYANPAGARIQDIHTSGSSLIFATTNGTIRFDGIWGFYEGRGLGERTIYQVSEESDNLWFLGRDKIDINADAVSELTLMHVNWLPELADDIYYEFLGFVRNVEGWGTIGINVTYLTYGTIIRTNEYGVTEGDFTAYDVAFTLSYGIPLTASLSGGISAKVIYSHLSDQGAGAEKGSGTSTGLAVDLGLLYHIDPRMTLGLALTNLGPDISYIDVAQSDPLPRNLAVGLAWKMIQSQYNEVLFTIEANKSLADRDKSILEDFRDVIANPQDELKGFVYNPFTFGGLSKEFKGVIINGGIEYKYSSFIAFRAGYIHDEEGEVNTPTLGFGLAYNMFKFDFAYIPSSDDVPLANTMRYSLSVRW
ncbi:MAG: PorV/PorQ family protein, partial [Candidatus Zixiibacteriota bacterium]